MSRTSPDDASVIPVSDTRGTNPDAMIWVDGFSKLLDAKFRIPGTRVRFGADFLLGLVPGVGDAMSLGLSGILIATMAKNGASLRLVLRMLGNVVLDAIVGTVPIAGNLFDLFFRANTRNAQLMREHYEQGKHNAHAWPILLAIAVIVIAVFAALLVLLLYVVSTLWNWVWPSG